MRDVSVLIPALVLLVAAAALTALAIALLRGRLPRNRWAGVRTPASLASDEAFRLANKVAGLPVLAGAVFLALGAVTSVALDGALRSTAVLMCVVAAVAIVAAGGVLGTKAAAQIPACGPERCPACTGCTLIDTQH